MKMTSFAFFTPILLFALLQVSQAGPLRLQKRAAFYIANETENLKDIPTKSSSDAQNYAVTSSNSKAESEVVEGGRMRRAHFDPVVEEGEDIEEIIRSILEDEFARMREREAANLEPENKRTIVESTASGQSVRMKTKMQVHPPHPDAVPEEVLRGMGIYKGAELQKKMEIFKNMYEKNMRINQNDDTIIQYPSGNFAPPGSVCLFGGFQGKYESFEKVEPSQEPSPNATRQPDTTGGNAANSEGSSGTKETAPHVSPVSENKYAIRSFARGHFSEQEPDREYEDFDLGEIAEQKVPVLKARKSVISPLISEDKSSSEEETEADDGSVPKYTDENYEGQTSIRIIHPMLTQTGVGVGTIEIEPNFGTPPPDVLREILMFAMTYENSFGATTSSPGKESKDG